MPHPSNPLDDNCAHSFDREHWSPLAENLEDVWFCASGAALAIGSASLVSNAVVRHITFGIFIGFTLSATSTSISSYWRSRRRQSLSQEQHEPRPIELRSNEVVHGVTGLIGNTPLVRIDSLSNALGVEILGKAEFLNPGGSVKDRVALRTIIMPDDVAQEKVNALHALGADVQRVRPASIVDQKTVCGEQFLCRGKPRNEHLKICNKNIASEQPSNSDVQIIVKGSEESHTSTSSIQPRGFFADQFEVLTLIDNVILKAHYNGTVQKSGVQTNSHVDAFISEQVRIFYVRLVRFFNTVCTRDGWNDRRHWAILKSMDEEVQVVLADPEGSGLYNKVKHGVMYDAGKLKEQKRRHQVDTVVEGIGINRMTNNIDLAIPIIDDAFRITDVEAVAMSRYLVQNDGLFLGSSSAAIWWHASNL
ncbi:hypothetical protein BDR07DRAFT_1375367 [Suillus spraguei]|nr:hypothetical protein BDR07DRAFT_1375367 [Suillus spraguei]